MIAIAKPVKNENKIKVDTTKYHKVRDCKKFLLDDESSRKVLSIFHLLKYKNVIRKLLER
jgi:hypothetical protein